MRKEHTRREILAGAASAAAMAALPALPVPPSVASGLLWPTDTQAQREMVIVRAIKTHIATTEDRAERSVTPDDIYDVVRRFGMFHGDVLTAIEGIKARGRITWLGEMDYEAERLESYA